MRKWIVLPVLVLVLCSGFVYFIIPNNLSIQQATGLSVNAKGFSRLLFNEANWLQWWPKEDGRDNAGANSFAYNGNRYTLLERKLSSLIISISKGQDSMLTELVVIPVQNDSVELNWMGAMKAKASPVLRIQRYHWVKGLDNDLHALLEKLRAFAAKEENLYGLRIEKQHVIDSTLISTSASTKFYPTSTVIYSLVDRLQAFAAQKGARQTGLPMLNITANTDSSYLTKVALPVDKKLKDEGDIQYKWMLGGGNILVAEVKGGPHQIDKAFAAMENYVSDFNRIAPAIPFQSLVTDRRQEPDTNKWITRIYWPVM